MTLSFSKIQFRARTSAHVACIMKNLWAVHSMTLLLMFRLPFIKVCVPSVCAMSSFWLWCWLKRISIWQNPSPCSTPISGIPWGIFINQSTVSSSVKYKAVIRKEQFELWGEQSALWWVAPEIILSSPGNGFPFLCPFSFPFPFPFPGAWQIYLGPLYL